MKIILLTAVFFSPALFAKNPTKHPACVELAKECRNAGYTGKGHNTGGKGLWADCIHLVAEGKSVSGVSFSKEKALECERARQKIQDKSED